MKIEKVEKLWLKPYIDMNTELSQKAENNFEKGFFKLMNNAVLGKTMEHVRKHRNIKRVTTERKRNHLVSEPNYHTKKFFLLKVKKVKLCYLDTDSLIAYVTTNDVYKCIAENIETRFDNSNFELGRPLPQGKNRKVIGLTKDGLGRRIMKEFFALKAKTYS